MTDRQLDEEKIFHIARGIDAVDLRADYLTQICAGDQALRERVEALLAAHEQEQTLLKSNVAVAPTAEFSGVTEAAGDVIGRYKLLQKIGEGGFGVVYLAEQSRPVRRKVALKVIKPGMDTRAVVARFEAERQALALMDHANIAKVFDGGATESGRPYFVMELVKGVPITEFCDENKFTVRQRLELFATVCRAIQHAHQKGVIHRDIKPSNVLVTLHDGVPVAKVIDFGVSKAISQQLTEKTLFTAHGQMIGTPQYMSPEQAEMSGLDIDTRSDIYSLGILLYELLTGCTPLEPAKIRGTAYVELQRMIREEEPLRPSRRCSTLGKQSATIAAKRQTDPQKLGSQLRGELDWIVMKSLEKDRNRRYDSANSLGDDVSRFLDGEVVAACPPSAAYRFQKFAGRHKSLLLTGGLVAIILLMASIVSSVLAIQYSRTADQLEQTLAELRKARTYEQQTAIDRAIASAAFGNITQAREAIDAANLDNPEAYLEMIEGQKARFDGRTLDGIEHLEKAYQLAQEDVIIQAMLADAYLDSGNWESYAHTAVAQDRVSATTDLERMFLGHALCWTDTEKSLELLDKAVENTRHPLAFVYRARTLSSIANATENDAQMETALRDVNRGCELLPESSLARSIRLNVHLFAYDLYLKQGLPTRAEQMLQEAGRIVAQAEEYRDSYESGLGMGLYYQACGEDDKAQEKFKKTASGRARVFAYALHPDRTADEVEQAIALLDRPPFGTERSIVGRCVLLLDQGRKDEADSIIDDVLSKAPQENWGWAIDLALLRGRYQEATQLASQLYEQFPQDARGIRYEFLRFQSGNSSAEDYINSSTHAGRGGAYYQIGIYWLARGERQLAKEYFRENLRHSVPPETGRAFGQAFLTRMEDDPAWPSWIPPGD